MSVSPWYSTGSVAVTNGSAVVTGTGTSFVDNVDAGQGFLGPDFSLYEIASVDSQLQITLKTNYRGSAVSGAGYVIPPLQGYTRSAAQQLAAMLSLITAWTGLAASDGDIIQFRGTAWAVRTPAELLLDQANDLEEATIASAGTCNIGGVTSPKLVITGTTGITSFGAVPNCIRFVRFAASLTITYNATSLILPGAANKTTAAGDTAIFMSDASGNWRCFAYQAA